MPKKNQGNGASSTSRADNSSEIAAQSQVVSGQRRKLIKASAAAVPAIMTLRSGAAAAAASMHYCIAKDAARAATEIGPADRVFGDDADETALDEWVRIIGKAGRKVIYTDSDSVDQTGYCIRDKDSTAPWDTIDGWNCYGQDSMPLQAEDTITPQAWAAATNFYCVNKAGVWECVADVGGLMMPPIVTPTIPAAGIDAGKDIYLLVYVRSFDNQIQGATYYPNIALMQDVDGFPITASCLCSVDPDFNILG